MISIKNLSRDKSKWFYLHENDELKNQCILAAKSRKQNEMEKSSHKSGWLLLCFYRGDYSFTFLDKLFHIQSKIQMV